MCLFKGVEQVCEVRWKKIVFMMKSFNFFDEKKKKETKKKKD